MCEGSGNLNRRTFLEGMFVASAAVASGSYLWQHRHGAAPAGQAAGMGVWSIEDELAQMPERHMTKTEIAESVHLEIARDEAGLSLEEMTRATQPDMNLEHLEKLVDEIKQQQLIDQHEETLARAAENAYTQSEPETVADSIELNDDFLERARHFDQDFSDDIRLSESEWATMVATSRRIETVRDYVGFGNFNIINWDDMLAYARNVSSIGRFTPAELEFMEALFHADVTQYGFYGERTNDRLSKRIERSDVYKVPRSGHFLLRGESLDLFNRLQGDIGDSLILTSGVRSIPKQFDLFLAKVKQTEGNMSRASRSLAPPGHSYHALGDFDVGKYGLGLGNFSEEFARTSVFRQLQETGYTNIRYTVDNRFGVRFEPWHVRAV